MTDSIQDQIADLRRRVANLEQAPVLPAHGLDDHIDADVSKTRGRRSGLLWSPTGGAFRPGIHVGDDEPVEPEEDDVWIGPPR